MASFEDRQNWDFWKAREGMSKEEAMSTYIEAATKYLQGAC